MDPLLGVVILLVGVLFGALAFNWLSADFILAQKRYIKALEDLVDSHKELGKHLYRQANAFHVTSNALHDWFDVAPLAIKIEIAKIFNKSSAELNLDVDAAESRHEELMAEKDAKKVA